MIHQSSLVCIENQVQPDDPSLLPSCSFRRSLGLSASERLVEAYLAVDCPA